MTVYLPKNATTWVYDFWLKGKRHTGNTEATTKRAAVAYEARVREQLRVDPFSAEAPTIRIDEMLALYINEHPAAAASKASYESRARRIARDCDVSRSSHEVHTAFILKLTGTWTKAGLSGNAQRSYLNLLRAALTYARRRGYRVARDIEWPSPKAEQKTRYLSPDEARALVEALDPNNRIGCASMSIPAPHVVRGWRDQHDLVVLLLDTGCRYGEIAKLPWSSVRLDEGVLEVRRWKTGRTDVVALTRRARQVLEARRLDHPRTTWVFPGDNGRSDDRPRGYSTVGIHAVMDNLGFNPGHRVDVEGKATVHSLRHTFASRLVEKHGLAFVRDRLGHSSIQQTERYAHLDRARGAIEAAATLDALDHKG